MILNDETLTKIKANDRKAITAFYYQIFSVLMSVAIRYKQNEEDQKTIVNNSFIKIIKQIESYKKEKSIVPWASQIARNEVIDSYRKEKNYLPFFDFETESEEIETENVIEYDLEVEQVYLRNLLSALPPATNLVFNLYAIEEWSTKEICEELNISYETVKWHIKEARKKLRHNLSSVHKTHAS